MPILEALLAFLTQNNSSPSGDERLMEYGVTYDTPCRAFYLEDAAAELTYETATGQIITKIVSGRIYHPIKIKRLLGSGPTEATPTPDGARVFALW